MTSLRVVVADDHDLFRRGLTEVLEEEPDIEVVGEARNGQEAVQRAEQLMPDVFVHGPQHARPRRHRGHRVLESVHAGPEGPRPNGF